MSVAVGPRRWLTGFGLCACLTIIAACNGASSSETAQNGISGPFIPPTMAAPTVQAATPRVLPIASPAGLQSGCSDYLSYLEDLSIPDKTAVLPGTLLDKRWQVRNSGTCNWDSDYRLRLIAGPAMNAPSEQALFPARAGSDVMLRIQFIAPPETGTYRSAWQAANPDGTLFGDVFFIEIVVAPSLPATESASATQTPTP